MTAMAANDSIGYLKHILSSCHNTVAVHCSTLQFHDEVAALTFMSVPHP